MHTKRLYEIDLLRFFAALIVVLFHFNIDSYKLHHHYLVDNVYLNNILLRGNLGVRLFFIISGFVILMSARITTPVKFIKSRVLRLYPAFVPLCIFTFIVGRMLDKGYSVTYTDFIVNLTLIGTLLSNFHIKLVSGVYWTLVVEMQFYFFVFLMVYFKKMNYIRTFLLAWLLISIVTYYGELYFNYHHLFNKVRMLLITEHSFYFIAGCYFYLIKYQKKATDVLMPLVVLLFAILCFIDHHNNILSISSGATIVAYFAIFYNIAFRDLNFSKRLKLYQTLGNLTYPLYLIHEELGNIIIALLLPFLDRSLILLSSVIIVVCLTYLFNRYVERPLTKTLKKVLYTQTKSQMEASIIS